MKLHPRKRKGSILIIAILFCLLMTTAIAGAGRLVMNEAVVSSSYQDELVARYAAEAGMEAALAIIRADPTVAAGYTSADPLEIKPPLVPTLSLSGANYQVKMWRFVDAGDPESDRVVLEKDRSIELDVSQWKNQQMTIEIYSAERIAGSSSSCPSSPYIYLDIKQIKNTTPSLAEEPLTGFLVRENIVEGRPASGGIATNPSGILLADGDRLRVRAYLTPTARPKTEVDFSASNQVIPASCNYRVPFKIFVASGTHAGEMDIGITTVISTGNYGESSKTFQAQYLATSRNALEIFDYVIYAGESFDLR